MLKRNITGFRSPNIWRTNLKAIKCSSGCVMKLKMLKLKLCFRGRLLTSAVSLLADQPTTYHEEGGHPNQKQEDVQQVQEEQKDPWQHGGLLQKLDGKEQFLQPSRPVASHDLVPSLLAFRPHVDHAHPHAPFFQLALRPSPPFQYGDGDGLEHPATSDRPISRRWTSLSTVNLEACHPPQPSDLEPALSHAPSERWAPPKTPSPVCPA